MLRFVRLRVSDVMLGQFSLEKVVAHTLELLLLLRLLLLLLLLLLLFVCVITSMYRSVAQ